MVNDSRAELGLLNGGDGSSCVVRNRIVAEETEYKILEFRVRYWLFRSKFVVGEAGSER